MHVPLLPQQGPEWTKAEVKDGETSQEGEEAQVVEGEKEGRKRDEEAE